MQVEEQIAVLLEAQSGRDQSPSSVPQPRVKGQDAKKLAHEWWMERMNPKKGWKAVLEENGERLDAGVEAVQR